MEQRGIGIGSCPSFGRAATRSSPWRCPPTRPLPSADYTDAVVDAIGDRTSIVVVAQSIGGFVGPLVCDRVPVELLVLVNAMVPAPGESAGAWWDNTGHPAAHAEAAERAGRDPHAEFDPMTEFFHDVPIAVRKEAMSGSPSAPSEAFFADPWPLDCVARRADALLPGPRRPVPADRVAATGGR